MSQYRYFTERPKKLTARFAATSYQQLVARIQPAESSKNADLWLELFRDWNHLKAYLWGESARIRFTYDRDMSNADAEAADTYLREKVGPVTDEPEHTLVTALVKSKHRGAVAARYGEKLLIEYEHSLKLLDPINTKLGIKAGRLTKDYEKKIAGGTVTILGETKNISEARTMLFSPDATVRKAAYLAHRGWFLEHREALAKTYDQLVNLRTKMAQNVGYENYIPLGYEGMSRIEYGRSDVESFRASVKKYIVPLVTELSKKQVQGLGTGTLQPWDMLYFPDSGIPTGSVPIATQLDSAAKVFQQLSPDLARHFSYMRKNDLIDLETRAHKRTGGYCNKAPDTGDVVILCNSVGDADDVHVLTHEMGHAFQGYETNGIEAVELQWPSAEFCEVFSMGMEFLCMPHINHFFDESNAERFTKNRYRDSLDVLVYVCIVDEFQHWVYENPTSTTTERDQAWIRIWKEFRPHIDFSEVGDEYIAARWYAQTHIFSIPFYYIDYALAETGALQLAMLNEKDPQQTLELYLKLARLGGTKGMLEAFADVGLRSPFDATLLKDIASMLHSKVMPHQ